MISSAKKLWHIVKKNIKILFRNWTSFILLILGPFILVLLLGFVFSGTSVQGITIGVVASGETNELIQTFSKAFTVDTFDDLEQCTHFLKRDKVNVCADFSDITLNQSAIQEGKITLLYDNSKVAVSKTIVSYMQTQLGLTADEITLEAVQTILQSIESVVTFMEESQQTIDEFRLEMNSMQQDVRAFEEQILATQQGFAPVYADMLELQTQLNSGGAGSEEEINAKLDEISTTLATASSQISDLQTQIEEQSTQVQETKEAVSRSSAEIDTFLEENQNVLDEQAILALTGLEIHTIEEALEEETYDVMLSDLEQLNTDLEQIDADISVYQSDVSAAQSDLPKRVAQFNEIVVEAGKLNAFLSSAVNLTQQTTLQLDQSVQTIESLSTSLETTIDSFGGFTPEQAKAVVTPIKTSQEPLLKQATTVFLYFPIILPIVIIFVSILFSNIIILDEIYSSAQMRNFIMPVHDGLLLGGFLLTNVIITLFQVTILLLFAALQLDIPIFEHLGTVAVATVLLNTIFVLIGMIIAYATKTKENSILISTFASVAFFLFSNVILPTELMPPVVSTFVGLNPIVIASSIYRQSLFFDVGLGEAFTAVAMLLFYIVILLGVLFYVAYHHRHRYR